VVAACSPRTHEPLFRATMKEVGLNPSLFEMANIRDQCSWVHRELPREATRKSMIQVDMAVARAGQMRPVDAQVVRLTSSVLVLGGGITGLTAALAAAANGFQVYLVEKSAYLGGSFRRLHSLADDTGSIGDSPGSPSQVLESLINEVEEHSNVRVMRETVMVDIEGYVGNFHSHLRDGSGEIHEVTHGAVIIATGASELDRGSALEDFIRAPGTVGDTGNIMTLLELEEKLLELEGKPDELEEKSDELEGKPNELEEKSEKGGVKGSMAFIQCAGSRNGKRPYCSRICCSASLKNAVLLKEHDPERPVYILYRDMRAYGMNELLYRRAAGLGVRFVRYPDDDLPTLEGDGAGGLSITVMDENIGEELCIDVDNLVLAAATVPGADNESIAEMLKVPLNQDGFFLEAHVKLRPVEFATDGIFLAGAAHSPKTARESITQALAAASRAAALLSRGEMTIESTPAFVDAERCSGCATCIAVCPYGAITKDDDGKAVVLTASCKSCGACASMCPENAIRMLGFSSEEIIAEMEAALGGLPDEDGEVAV